MTTGIPMRGEPIAAVRRSGVIESVHTGHVQVRDASGTLVLNRGSDVEFFPRSSLKPLQALAMLRAGARLTDAQLALACASHAGTPAHTQVALSTLASVGLDETALSNTADMPLCSEAAAEIYRAGGGQSSLTQNCSGKHAAMIATCVAAGWDTSGYYRADHPLQRHILATLAELTGVGQVGVDGCGAPAPTLILSGLARAARRVMTAPAGTDEARIVTAMSAHPELVSGEGRFDTLAMRAVPGSLTKGGAEGVLLAAFGDGATIVSKIADGTHRANNAAYVAGLAALGIEADTGFATVTILGHGEPVGQVEWVEQAGPA